MSSSNTTSHLDQVICECLITRKFFCKKPKEASAKTNKSKQKEFIKTYEFLKEEVDKKDNLILPVDSAHSSIIRKISYGWIKKEKDKAINHIFKNPN